MNILDILQRIREAQYEHMPTVEDVPEGSVPFGDEGDTIGLPPPQATRPGPDKRTGGLSAFGRFTQGALPEILRGAMVGAGSNGGENARGVFGAMQAVNEDRQGRDMLRVKMQRQAQQDAMDQRLNDARAKDYEAQAELSQWRTQQAPRDAKKQAVTPAEKVMQLEEALGRKLTEREKQTALGLFGPQYDVKSDTAFWSRRLSEAKTPEELAAIWEERQQMEGGLAEAKAGGAAKGRAANTPIKGKLVPTKEGLREYIPKQMLPSGKEYSSSSVSAPVAQPPDRPKPSPKTPPRQRIITREGADGKLHRIDVDTGKDLGPVDGFTPKPPSTKSINISEEVKKFLTGGGTSTTQRTISRAQVEAYAKQYKVSYDTAKKKAIADGYTVAE